MSEKRGNPAALALAAIVLYLLAFWVPGAFSAEGAVGRHLPSLAYESHVPRPVIAAFSVLLACSIGAGVAAAFTAVVLLLDGPSRKRYMRSSLAAILLLAGFGTWAACRWEAMAHFGVGAMFTAAEPVERGPTSRSEGGVEPAGFRGPDSRLGADRPKSKGELLAEAARAQVGVTVTYDPAYVKLAYPGGDVPADRGVCIDVVIRALRPLGADLQVLVHEDMTAAFGSYPKLWGLRRPDRNIDHRRVPNVATYLRRHGKAVAVTRNAEHYLPGDIVVWRLDNGRPHTGIVANETVAGTGRRKIIHNIGAGARVEDTLFAFEITGHFRYF